MTEGTKSPVIAPYIGKIDKTRPTLSFAAYFLRDLHQQGRLKEDILRKVIAEQHTESSADDIWKAIADHSGDIVSEQLAQDLDRVAAGGAGQN